MHYFPQFCNNMFFIWINCHISSSLIHKITIYNQCTYPCTFSFPKSSPRLLWWWQPYMYSRGACTSDRCWCKQRYHRRTGWKVRLTWSWCPGALINFPTVWMVGAAGGRRRFFFFFFCALQDSCSLSARTWGNYQVESVFHKARSVELASQSPFSLVLQNLSTSSASLDGIFLWELVKENTVHVRWGTTGSHAKFSSSATFRSFWWLFFWHA